MKAKELAKKIISLSETKDKEKIVKATIDYFVQKKKIYFLNEILRELKKIEKENEIELILARDLSEDFKEKLKEKIKKIFKKKKKIKIKIDPEIIAGFLIKEKNFLIDASIKGIIENLKWKYTRF